MNVVTLEETLKNKLTNVSEKNCIICGQPISTKRTNTGYVSYCSKCCSKKVKDNEVKRKANNVNILGEVNDLWKGFEGNRSLPQSLRIRKEVDND